MVKTADKSAIEEAEQAKHSFASKVAYRLVLLGIGIPTGIAIRKGLEGLWLAARPDNPPHHPDDPDVTWGDAIGYAALTAVGLVAADLATRKAGKSVWLSLTGSDDPPSARPKAAVKRAVPGI